MSGIMDSLITAAAHALARGDPFGALNRVALRDDAPALALRGIAMAQLGDLVKARELIRRAARNFGARQQVARARCVVAEIEIALVSRDLRWSLQSLDHARAVLAAHGDRVNAALAASLAARRLLLTGHLDEARDVLAGIDADAVGPTLRTMHELVLAGVAIRRVQTTVARQALQRAAEAAASAGIASLSNEVQRMAALLAAPAARLSTRQGMRLVRLDEVESLLASSRLIVDACRAAVRSPRGVVALARRPLLFALVRALAEAWPQPALREHLIARVFRIRRPDETDRARLRVEVGRLRRLLRDLARIEATAHGFRLEAVGGAEVAVLAEPVDGEHGALLALLSDGQSWSSSGLALALGNSQRSVQRGLETLRDAGKVGAVGGGRSRRWIAAPMPEFATALLLPTPLPDG